MVKSQLYATSLFCLMICFPCVGRDLPLNGTWLASQTLPGDNLDFTVAGTIPAIAQQGNNTCWATTATMMMSWRDQSAYTVQAAMDKAGATYRQKVDHDKPLYGDEKSNFLSAIGMVGEPPASYTAATLVSLLKSKGPLWVTTYVTDSTHPFSILSHARILYGIHGDGSLAGTSLRLIDPADGSQGEEALGAFIKRFEDFARAELGAAAQLAPQISHFSASRR
jgi:hypothetical protein